MLKFIKIKEIHIFSINIDGTLKEKIEVFKRDDDLIPPLRFQNTSSRISVSNGIVNYSLILRY